METLTIGNCIANSSTNAYNRNRKVVFPMAAKSATVTARISPDVKQQAEAILEQLGIPVSVFIDMTYRQVIMNGGVPFSVNMRSGIKARDAMTDDEFNAIMAKGYAQAMNGETRPAHEVFDELLGELDAV